MARVTVPPRFGPLAGNRHSRPPVGKRQIRGVLRCIVPNVVKRLLSISVTTRNSPELLEIPIEFRRDLVIIAVKIVAGIIISFTLIEFEIQVARQGFGETVQIGPAYAGHFDWYAVDIIANIP